MLFVPANAEKFIAKAHTRGADAVILDLEDSVSHAEKSAARSALRKAAEVIHAHGTDVLVRINTLDRGGAADIAAAVSRAVKAIVLPKVDSASAVLAAVELLEQEQAKSQAPEQRTWVIAQIEDVAALPLLDSIASASPRLLGMSLGSEDFSNSAGMLPTPETLYGPNQEVVFACRRSGIQPFGFPASIAEYADTQAFKRTAKRAVEMGMVGAFCIHPAQVETLNNAFAPSPELAAQARSLLAAFATAQAQGRAAIEHQGVMVDLPVASRAQAVIRRYEAARASLISGG